MSGNRLLTAIGRGEVGAVFAIEASRLARNGRDWHTRLEFGTLIIEEDGIYDPRSSNDQIVLGLKGAFSVIGIPREWSSGERPKRADPRLGRLGLQQIPRTGQCPASDPVAAPGKCLPAQTDDWWAAPTGGVDAANLYQPTHELTLP